MAPTKLRAGQVANRPVYVAHTATCDGLREVFGLWVGDGGEGAKFWRQVHTDLKNRGVADIYCGSMIGWVLVGCGG